MKRVRFLFPESIDRPEIVGQLAGFAFYTSLGLYRTYQEKGLSAYGVAGIIFFFLVEFTWLNLLANGLMVRYSSRKQPLSFYAGLLGLLGSYVLVRYLTAYPDFVDILNSYEGEKQPPSMPSFLFLQLVNFSLTFVVATALRLYKNVAVADRRARDLELAVEQANRQMLTYQINPHFLYNTLNYMYSEAQSCSEDLSESILLLSGVMRHTLGQSGEGGSSTPLQKEVRYLQDFVSLYRFRFNPTFYVDFTVEGQTQERQIAPLLLITFVENALKHGVLDDATQPVRITVDARATSLFFSVWNRKQRGLKDRTRGVGIPSVRKRLELLYPGRHELLIHDTPESFRVELTIRYEID